MVTQVPRGGLTSVEVSLVEHVVRGEWLDLAAGDEAVEKAAMRSWSDSRTCRASVIRDILRGRLAGDPDPHGLRFRGARISGRLDLENLITDVNLELKDCLLEEGVLARDAHLASVSLTGCQIEHPAEPPLEADGGRIQLIVATPRCRRWSDGSWTASAGGSSVSGSDAVAAALHGRPRKTLGWKTPAEALDEFLYSCQQGGVATTS